MSLFDLKSLVSKEDFADAHEPLNDGIKDVPNAQTVASSVKTGDVGTDTTTAGPAKVVPEKTDTDDQTKTEHNVVKESAEKSGGNNTEEKPQSSPPESKPNSAIPETKDGSEETTSEVEADELEHTTKKAAEADLDKTERATKGLEAYAPQARRFDIIGHPKAKSAEIGQMISYLHRKAGGDGKVTVSAESIDAAIGIGKLRKAKLESTIRRLSTKVSNEDISDSMDMDNPPIVEEVIVTAEPTEHGAPPMDPVAAAALTEAEIDPLNVPVLEIQRVQETIQTLETGAAAIEQYRQIIKANPRMSKQAAAVLHAGLEHIDRTCGLKVRATGMEGYLTTPRAAMEEADEVDEKTLGSRAAEIGAKLLAWIKKLVEMATEAWAKYQTGLDQLKDRCLELSKQKFKTEGQLKLQPVPGTLFLEGEFYGEWLTPDEEALPSRLAKHYGDLTKEITRRVRALMSKDSSEDIALVMEALAKASGTFAETPGPRWVVSEQGKLLLGKGNPEAPDSYVLEIGDMNPQRLLNAMAKSIEAYTQSEVVNQLKKASDDVTKALVAYRKGKGKEMDEGEFQKVQQVVVDNSVKLFDVEKYFEILKYIGTLYSARYKLCASLVTKAETAE